MKQKWIWLVLLIVTFTLGLAFSAFAIAATPMSIKHNQKLSTPYELIKKKRYYINILKTMVTLYIQLLGLKPTIMTPQV